MRIFIPWEFASGIAPETFGMVIRHCAKKITRLALCKRLCSAPHKRCFCFFLIRLTCIIYLEHKRGYALPLDFACAPKALFKSP